MNLLRVLLRSVCGSHPSDVPPKSKISVQIEQNGNGRRSGAFLHISFKNSSICKAFGVRQRPPQGAEFVCVPCGANNSKSTAGDSVPVRVRSPAPTAPADPLGLRVLFFFCGSGSCIPGRICLLLLHFFSAEVVDLDLEELGGSAILPDLLVRQLLLRVILHGEAL